MEASINKMQVTYIGDVYFTSSFRKVLEDHMTFLRTHEKTQMKIVQPLDLQKYRFDLTGLLNNMQIPLHMHWIIARMNNLTSLTDVPEELSYLLIPDSEVVDGIRQIHANTTTS